MDEDNESYSNEDSTSKHRCRWSTYGNYRQLLWVWMMNEITVVSSPAEISHNGYYIPSALQTLAVIFIGIPLVYSEICLAQYTNCNIISMWNFFPFFRCVGFATFYLIFLKTIYVLVLCSWYLEYTIHSAFNPPPWFTCEGFNETSCMVKRVNVSIFQHCLEAMAMSNYDCGMKTASSLFFEHEIGTSTATAQFINYFPWKEVIASSTISILLFILSIKKEKLIQVVAKILMVYIFIVILVLFCVALSMSGSWYYSSAQMNTAPLEYATYLNELSRGFLSVGTGCGMTIFLTYDVSFRSPATMSSIGIPLFSLLTSLMFSLIIYGGIKTVSFFHGEAEDIIEIGETGFFREFASISEVLSYFDGVPFWTFVWFSAIGFCLFGNLWILHLFLEEYTLKIEIARRYTKTSHALLISAVSVISWPFFYCDLTSTVKDVCELIQLINSFMFSISLYWFYGLRNHNNDIIFMLGVKASYFWKIAWLFNPILILFMVFIKCENLLIYDYNDSLLIKTISMPVDVILFFVLISVYFVILIIGMVAHCILAYKKGRIKKIFSPSNYWGPTDETLYKSRKMFVPEIMTTEFLYRQVRIRGYFGEKKGKTQQVNRESIETKLGETQWSPLTSN